MKTFALLLLIATFGLASCDRSARAGDSAPTTAATVPGKTPDAVERKLQEFAGASATDCGRLNVQENAVKSKAASDCAMQASQNKHAFYVAYDMPGMAVGVAGNASGKLFSVQSQGEGPKAELSSGDCPSQLRLAGSGRVTCFAPGDMGSMGAGHTAVPPGMPNPHALPLQK